jgi:uncharacterized protein YajQ (UPF0234 family)
MADSSFDVVSDFEQQELVNALDQVRREVATRYDFKGSKVSLELGKTEITLHADDEFRAGSVKDLLLTKAVRRGLSLKVFDWGKLEPAAGGTIRQRYSRGSSGRPRRSLRWCATVPEGGHPRRRGAVIGKSKDELRVIAPPRARLRVALQFINYR